jgi:SHS family lactate transporter-like MFS transporter
MDHANHTVPTGLSSLPPSGPATPLTATAMFAPLSLSAPSAISRTTGSLTAPYSTSVRFLTPNIDSFAPLL